jgi:hypothetical protein
MAQVIQQCKKVTMIFVDGMVADPKVFGPANGSGAHGGLSSTNLIWLAFHSSMASANKQKARFPGLQSRTQAKRH